MSIVTIFLIGVAACVIFDLWQILFAKITGIPPSNWAITGRWCIGALTKGRFYAPNIEQIAPRPRELAVGWLLHYAVAISYAFIFWGLVSFGSESYCSKTIIRRPSNSFIPEEFALSKTPYLK